MSQRAARPRRPAPIRRLAPLRAAVAACVAVAWAGAAGGPGDERSAIPGGAGSAPSPAAGGRAAPGGREVLLLAGRMLDVRSGRLRSDVALRIRGGRIEAVTEGSGAIRPPGAHVIDLRGATLLPGLIDAHVHLAWGAAGAAAGGAEVPAGAAEALATLRAGFTTVRNLGSTGGADLALRDAVASGRVPGPHILAAGAPVGAPGGVCDQVFAGEGTAAGPEEAARRVRDLVARGADVVKLCAGGGVLPSSPDAEATEYAEAEIRAIVREAHARGRKAAAHAQGPAAILNAVRAGVDSIEHAGMIDREAARLMKRKGVFLVPTLYRLDWTIENARSSGAGAASLEALEAARLRARTGAAQAIAMGVRVALGTDATVFPHGLNAKEITVLVEVGMKPIDALRAATIHAAELLGIEDRAGALEPGLRADVIAVAGDPLQAVSVLEHVGFVMKDGVVVRDDLSRPVAAQANPAPP